MRILVTGSTGFIGTCLKKTLAIKHNDFKCVVRKNTYSDDSEIVCENITSSTNWSGFFKDIDVVIHLAGCAHKIFSEDEYFEINYKATENLAKQAASSDVKRFIYISTLLVHGNVGQGIKSTSTISPNSLAAKSKYQAEQALKKICESSNMEFVIIRPPLVYGPGVKANFVALMKLASFGVPLPFGCITNNRLSMVYIENLVDLIIKCIYHHKAANQTFLVSDDDDLSTARMVKEMSISQGNKGWMLPVPVKVFDILGKVTGKSAIVERLCGSLQVDISKTKQLLDWQPPVSIKEAFNVTATHFIKI
ncbi:MAG: hypothetical protein COA74_00340 [Gammaproteobacteria bacterium]|nr:MAG: hypothetical protein COA74_00340 [Gammaproteobacteria bacterium]